MKRRSISVMVILLIIIVISTSSPENIFANDKYLRHNKNYEDQHAIRNSYPLLIPLKNWFQKISDPLTKCVQSEHESQTGWCLHYNNFIIIIIYSIVFLIIFLPFHIVYIVCCNI